jgi:hypothetical protein
VLNSIVKDVTAGCSAEFGLPQVQDTLNAVTQGYATFRSSVCLKEYVVSGALRRISDADLLLVDRPTVSPKL